MCDEARMKEVFTQESISHVIHFAALSHVGELLTKRYFNLSLFSIYNFLNY